MANVGPAAWYTNYGNGSSTGYYAVAAWAALTAYPAGSLVRQLATPAVGSERVFAQLVPTTGVSGSSEPSWTVTKGAKTTDATCTWIEVTGQPSVNGDFPAEYTTSGSATSGQAVIPFSTTTGIQVGMYVSVQSASGAIGSTAQVISVTPGVSVTLSANVTTTVPSGATVAFGYGPTWQNQKGSAVALGLVIYDPATLSLQVVSTAGTAGSTKPSFSATAGTTASDSGVTWTSLGLASSFGTWAAPQARVANNYGTNWAAAGNIIFMADNHAETQATTNTITGPGTAAAPIQVICVDHTATLPPGPSNLKTTATITYTGAAININGYQYYYGVSIISSAPAGGINIFTAAGAIRMDSCVLSYISGSPSNGQIVMGGVSSSADLQLNNTSINFFNTSQFIKLNNINLTWRGTPNAITGAIPTTLFGASTEAANALIEGVDISAVTTTLVGPLSGPVNFLFVNCKLASGVTPAAAQSAINAARVDFVLCDSVGTAYQQWRYRFGGTMVPSTTIVRTGGATDSVTPISWSVTTNAGASFVQPFELPECSIWNAVTGTNRNVTVYGMWNNASLPNDDQVWPDVEYMGSSGSPLASLGTGTKANPLAQGTPWTADTSAWDSEQTARQNSTAYTAGQSFTVGGGQVWFCTTGGTTAASQPAGYTGASDGSSVTDGTAVFRAGVRFAMTVALTSPQIQLVGDLRYYIRAALASTTFYIDPEAVLS